VSGLRRRNPMLNEIKKIAALRAEATQGGMKQGPDWNPNIRQSLLYSQDDDFRPARLAEFFATGDEPDGVLGNIRFTVEAFNLNWQHLADYIDKLEKVATLSVRINATMQTQDNYGMVESSGQVALRRADIDALNDALTKLEVLKQEKL
jgi:hypothetical protein